MVNSSSYFVNFMILYFSLVSFGSDTGQVRSGVDGLVVVLLEYDLSSRFEREGRGGEEFGGVSLVLCNGVLV